MQNILTIIKLEFMLNRKSDNKFKNVLAFLIPLLCIFLFSALVSAAVVICLMFFSSSTDVFGELSFIMAIITVIIFSYSLTLQIKSVFLFKQKEIMAYLPVSKKEIYIAKLCACFIKTAILNVAITLPSLIMFGIINKMATPFYFIAFAVTLLMTFLPFGFAGIVAIPFVYICNFLKNKLIIRLFAIVLLMLAAFYVYMQVIFELANIWLLKNSDSADIIYTIVEFCKKSFLPSSWASSIILQNNAKLSILYLLLGSVFICGILLLVGTFTYTTVFEITLIEKNLAKVIVTKTKAKSVFSAYFNFEIKDLFRRSDLLFTYVGMAIIMPFMVYFCDKFIVRFAVEKLGSTIVIGVTMLVVLIFVSIICSPSASLISKEGDGFWILKTNPNGIAVPMMAKALVTVCFSGSSLLITVATVCFSGIIDYVYGVQIFLIALIYMGGLITFGLLLNLAKPNVFYDYKENVSNVSVHLCTSLIFSLIVSVFAIIESFTFSIQTVLLYCLLFIGVLAAILIILLVLLHKRLYARMEI